MVLLRQSNALKSTIGDILNILFDTHGTQSEDSSRESVVSKLLFKFYTAHNIFDQRFFKRGGPDIRVFLHNGVNQICTEG